MSMPNADKRFYFFTFNVCVRENFLCYLSVFYVGFEMTEFIDYRLSNRWSNLTTNTVRNEHETSAA